MLKSATRPAKVPSYRLHKKSGQGIVTLRDGIGNRHDFLLGVHGTRESRIEYARVIAEWEAANRTIPLDSPTADLTVHELLVRFLKFADRHYRYPDGQPTTEIVAYEYAFKFLTPMYGDTRAVKFGPLALKAVRQEMIAADLCRNLVNRLTNRIRRMFKWAASEELVPANIIEGLRCVQGLQRGRCDARESEPVKPVPDAFVEAIRTFVSRSVWAMIELQRLTVMRPGEVVQMRATDIEMSGSAWLYRPPNHKMSYRDLERAVALGPKAQSIVREFLTTDTQAYLFSPRRDQEERAARLRAMRKTRVQPSQQNRRKRNPQKLKGDRFRRDSYTQAIHQGCKKADAKARVEATQAAEMAGKNPPGDDVVFVPTWGPNRLRHNFATMVRKQHGLEAAQVALGPLRSRRAPVLSMA
jgi:hypothetical protein